MISLSGELWVLLAGVLLAGVRLAVTGRRRRWRAVVALARQRRLGAERGDREDLPTRYGQLALMRHGYNRRLRDVIISVGPRPARAFCYHYEIGFGKRHESRDLTVAVVEAGVDRPGVWIGPGRDIEVTGAFGRYRSMAHARAGQEEDSVGPASLKVYAESTRWVETHLGPDVWGLLGGAEGSCTRTFEVRGPCVAVYEDRVGSAESQIELLARAEAVADRIERARAIDADTATPPRQGDGKDPDATPGRSGVKETDR